MSQIATKVELKQILAKVQGDLDSLEHRLLNEISPKSRALCGILQDVFKAGGKRARPAICFLVYQALKSDLQAQYSEQELDERFKEKIFLIAEISELIHTASLVHDDIIDNSFVRRSMPTPNSKWDNAITVISGDFMFARAAVNLAKLDCNEVVEIYAAVLEALCDGEIEQVEKKFDTESWDYYFSKSYKKTASLFEACARSVPALLMRGGIQISEETKQNLSDYGKNLGMAFQLVDDILDYSSDAETLGKPAGSDLKEGQVTLPLLYALEENHDKLQSLVREVAGGDADEDKLSELVSIVLDSGAIEKSFAKSDEYLQAAKSNLSVLEESEYKESLVDLLEFIKIRAS